MLSDQSAVIIPRDLGQTLNKWTKEKTLLKEVHIVKDSGKSWEQKLGLFSQQIYNIR